jgi:hypothetical protein
MDRKIFSGTFNIGRAICADQLRIPSMTGASVAEAGSIYYNSGTDNVYRSDGSQWIAMDNIYGNDGVLSGDRNIDADSHNMTISNSTNMNISGTVSLTDIPVIDNTETNFLMRNASGEVRLKQLTVGTSVGYSGIIPSNVGYTSGTLTLDYSGSVFGSGYSGGFYTVPLDGIYLVCANVMFTDGGQLNDFTLRVRLNATTVGAGKHSDHTTALLPPSRTASTSVSQLVDCSATDQISIVFNASDSGTISANNDDSMCKLSILKLI